MPPSDPPIIYVPPSPGSPPAAPGAVFVPPSPGSPPAAPGAIYVPPSPGSPPAAPGAVFVPGATVLLNYNLTGITNSNVNGPLFRGSGDLIKSFGRATSGSTWWTRDGSSDIPTTGYWLALYQQGMISVATATLAAIFPPAGYTAGTLAALNTARDGDGTTAGYGDAIRIGGSTYVLTVVSGTAQWTSYADDTNRGSTSIAAGTLILIEPSAYRVSIGWKGGLAATWAASGSTTYTWKLNQSLNGSTLFTGSWTGTGTSPATASWNTSGFQPGTVTLAAAAGVSPPPKIFVP